MKDLVEFVLRNLGLVIVIGGFLLTLLARSRQTPGGPAGKGRRTGSPMMPPFGGGSDRKSAGRKWPEPTEPSAERDGRTGAGRNAAEASAHGVPPDGSAAAGEAAAPFPDNGRGDHRSSGLAAVKPSAEAWQQEEAAAFAVKKEGRDGGLELSESEALRGMMWAEILGEPRSRKPYRPKS
ncbi:hypothetical protein ACFFNY_03100 [Paenibacillus hodogayensis]|uniref:Uncharacterized protein n=1 Tax=Paenibacillus hodogayensis TaxID=279208 RepID=A0ABV5VQV7_9BACL